MPKRGSLDDVPPWFHGIALEIRTFIHEAREDRKQAAKDRRGFNQTLRMMLAFAREFRTEQKKQTSILEKHTDILHDISRAVRVRGNGQKGNGK